MLTCDLNNLLDKLCHLTMPVCCIISCYYTVALYLRHSWTNTSIYCLFCACFVGEIAGQFSLRQDEITHPIIYSSVFTAVGVTSIFSSLQSLHSWFLIVLVIAMRHLACMTLRALPSLLCPMTAYASGIVGVLIAKYTEAVLKPPISSYMTSEGKIPVIKRRRSSSSSAHGFSSHRAGRRTSLPALIQKSQVRPAAIFLISYVETGMGKGNNCWPVSMFSHDSDPQFLNMMVYTTFFATHCTSDILCMQIEITRTSSCIFTSHPLVFHC